MSERFLRNLTDINDIFQDSKVACFRLVADIMSLVNKGNWVDLDKAGGLEELRGQLRRKFARLKSSWET